jgi:hypothetical protein
MIHKYPAIQKQIDVMDNYYLSMEDLAKRADESVHLATLQSVNARAHAKLLQSELESALRDSMSKTLERPSEKILKSIRARYTKGEANVIVKACEYYLLTDEQIKEILRYGPNEQYTFRY